MASFDVLLGLFGVISAIYFLGKVLLALRGPLASLPGPWISRFTHLRLKLAVLRAERVYYIHDLHEKYGPMVRISPHEVSVADAGATKEIHKISGGFRKSPWYQSFVGMEEDSFTMMDPHKHAARRRMMAAPYSETVLRAHSEPLIQNKVGMAIDQMKEEMGRLGYTDVMKWWMFMAADATGELAFCDSFRMLESGKKNNFIRDLETRAKVGGIRAELPFNTKILEYSPISAVRETFTANERATNYARGALERLKTQAVTNPESVRYTIFGKLYAENEKGDTTDDQIRAEAVSSIVAGTDTIAVTMAYLIWLVAKHPQIQETLLKSIHGVELSENFTSAEIKEKAPYVDLVIEEALRLHGPAPSSLPRTVPPEGRRLGGYFIPGGLTASTQSYTLHRSAEVYPNPDQFDPTRWENPTQTMKDAFMAFGRGSRACLGIHLARMELRLSVGHFYRAFPRGVRMAVGAGTTPSISPSMGHLQSSGLGEKSEKNGMMNGGGSISTRNGVTAEVDGYNDKDSLTWDRLQADAEKRGGMSDADMEMENYFLGAPKGHRCLMRAN